MKALHLVVFEFVESAPHTRKFLTFREKMHPDGIALFDELVNDAIAALTPKEPT